MLLSCPSGFTQVQVIIEDIETGVESAVTEALSVAQEFLLKFEDVDDAALHTKVSPKQVKELAAMQHKLDKSATDYSEVMAKVSRSENTKAVAGVTNVKDLCVSFAVRWGLLTLLSKVEEPGQLDRLKSLWEKHSSDEEITRLSFSQDFITKMTIATTPETPAKKMVAEALLRKLLPKHRRKAGSAKVPLQMVATVWTPRPQPKCRSRRRSEAAPAVPLRALAPREVAELAAAAAADAPAILEPRRFFSRSQAQLQSLNAISQT